MKQRLVLILFALAASLTALDAAAALTGARATPRQASITGTGPGVVALTWRIATTPDHRSGASSGAGTVMAAGSGTVLARYREPLAADGAGPYSLREVLRLDPASVRSWLERGLTRVVYTRNFVDAAGSSVDATVVLRLSRSGLTATRDAAPGDLAVTALRLEFDSASDTAVADQRSRLDARLTVTYRGTGVLQGRWQIAGPENPDGMPLYRTLRLVNEQLGSRQRTTLTSPPLPTDVPGAYRLRFCADGPGNGLPEADPECPDTGLSVTATYYVRAGKASPVHRIRDLSPDRQAVTAATRFRWQPLAGARSYQLQIFSLRAAGVAAPGSREPVAGDEPLFVTGMLLDAGTSASPLSALVLSRLTPGRRYLWRLSAFDAAGALLGRSTEASFVYEPAD